MHIDNITWKLVNSRWLLYKAFLSCKKTFWEEELDPYNWWIEDFESTKNFQTKYPYYCLLWFYNNKIIAWCSWNIFYVDGFLNAWIWYLWVDKTSNVQWKWIWTLLVQKVEKLIIDESQKKNIKLGVIFLESNKDIPEMNIKSSVWFWKKQGYKTIKDFSYESPCIKFDENNWNPLLEDVPLEFMIRIFEMESLRRDFLVNLISTVYKEWYSQSEESFKSNDVLNIVNSYIERKLEKIFFSLDGWILKLE